MAHALRRIGWYAGICWHYGLQRIKVDMSYRTDFLVQLGLSVLHSVVQLFFLWAIFYRVPDIQGYTFEAVVLIYGFGQLSFGYFGVGFFDMVIGFADFYIIEGNLDRPLLRPLPALLQMIMENLRFRDVTTLIKGTAIIWWAFANLDPPVPVNLATLGMAHVLAILGAFIYAGVFLFVTSLSFWVKDRIGFASPLFSINEASRYPITIYHPAVQLVFSVLIPFGYCAFYPAAYFTEPQRWSSWLIAAPFIAAATVTIGALQFNRGIRRYESTGS